MAANLLALMSGALGPQLIGAAGGFLGASESKMEPAVAVALPAVLGWLMQKTSTPAGAAALMSLLDAPGLDTGILGNLGSFLGGGAKTNALLKLGGSLLPGIFGAKTGSLVSAVGSIAGLNAASAANFMALATTMALAFLKRHVGQHDLDAGGLARLLAGQAGFLKSGLDGRIAAALGFASVGAFLSSLGHAADTGGAASPAAPVVGGPAVRRWLPWIILAGIALFAVPQLQHCGA